MAIIKNIITGHSFTCRNERVVEHCRKDIKTFVIEDEPVIAASAEEEPVEDEKAEEEESVGLDRHKDSHKDSHKGDRLRGDT